MEAEEAAMVSEEAASGKIRRREGEEDGDTEGDHLSLNPAQPSLTPSNHNEPTANPMYNFIYVTNSGPVAYKNKDNFVETPTIIPQVEMSKKAITVNNNPTITNKDGKIKKLTTRE